MSLEEQPARGKRRKWRLLLIAAVAVVLLLLVGATVCWCLANLGVRGRGEYQACSPCFGWPRARKQIAGLPLRALRVMTLNVAHGRKTSMHQALLSRDEIRANLKEVAALLSREKPDVMALQEADGRSAWSGGFDHLWELGESARYPCYLRGEHVKGLGLSYGTALLSRLPLDNPVSVVFAPTPPTFNKGFVAADVPWPGGRGATVRVVSAHLDFARESARRAQARDMAARLAGRGRLIVMGDFNCEWQGADPTLRDFAKTLGLRAFRPKAGDMATFRSRNKRFDWILISRGLRFKSCEVLRDVVSDHRAVVAEIELEGRDE